MKFSAFLQHGAYILAFAIFFFYMRDQQDQVAREVDSLRATIQTQDLRVTEERVFLKQWSDQTQMNTRRMDEFENQLNDLIKSSSKKPSN